MQVGQQGVTASLLVHLRPTARQVLVMSRHGSTISPRVALIMETIDGVNLDCPIWNVIIMILMAAFPVAHAALGPRFRFALAASKPYLTAKRDVQTKENLFGYPTVIFISFPSQPSKYVRISRQNLFIAWLWTRDGWSKYTKIAQTSHMEGACSKSVNKR